MTAQDVVIEERLGALEQMFADPWSPDLSYSDEGICQSPLHTGRFRLTGQIRQETADAYRTAYGISIDSADVYLMSISFGVGTNHIYLEYEKDGRVVVEKWAECEFLSHSEWAAK